MNTTRVRCSSGRRSRQQAPHSGLFGSGPAAPSPASSSGASPVAPPQSAELLAAAGAAGAVVQQLEEVRVQEPSAPRSPTKSMPRQPPPAPADKLLRAPTSLNRFSDQNRLAPQVSLPGMEGLRLNNQYRSSPCKEFRSLRSGRSHRRSTMSPAPASVRHLRHLHRAGTHRHAPPIPLRPQPRPPHGTLIGYISRANRTWRDSSTPAAEALAIFSISKPGASAPATGIPPADDRPRRPHLELRRRPRLRHLKRFFDDAEEPAVSSPNSPTPTKRPLPRRGRSPTRRLAYIDGQPTAIVGIELPITRIIEGKLKFNQNRSAEDRAGVIHASATSTIPAKQKSPI